MKPLLDVRLAYQTLIPVAINQLWNTHLPSCYGPLYDASQERGGLYFLEKGKTMTIARCQEMLNDNFFNHMTLHTIFLHDSAPWHKSNHVTKRLQTKNVQILEWARNSLGTHLIENVILIWQGIWALLRSWAAWSNLSVSIILVFTKILFFFYFLLFLNSLLLLLCATPTNFLRNKTS